MSTNLSRPPLFEDLDSVVGSPGSASKQVDLAVIQQVSESENFPNRDARRPKPEPSSEPRPSPKAKLVQAPPTPASKSTEEAALVPPASVVANYQPRRFRTGRNIPMNIKVDEATRQSLYEFAQSLDVPLGEVLERALSALKEQLAKPLKQKG